MTEQALRRGFARAAVAAEKNRVSVAAMGDGAAAGQQRRIVGPDDSDPLRVARDAYTKVGAAGWRETATISDWAAAYCHTQSLRSVDALAGRLHVRIEEEVRRRFGIDIREELRDYLLHPTAVRRRPRQEGVDVVPESRAGRLDDDPPEGDDTPTSVAAPAGTCGPSGARGDVAGSSAAPAHPEAALPDVDRSSRSTSDRPRHGAPDASDAPAGDATHATRDDDESGHGRQTAAGATTDQAAAPRRDRATEPPAVDIEPLVAVGEHGPSTPARASRAHRSSARREQPSRSAAPLASTTVPAHDAAAAPDPSLVGGRTRRWGSRTVPTEVEERHRTSSDRELRVVGSTPLEHPLPACSQALFLWVGSWLLPNWRRTTRHWCAQWWSHPEAVSRLDALWRAWKHLSGDPGPGLSIWWREHADYHLTVLTGHDGPFALCDGTAGHQREREVLPLEEPTPGTVILASSASGLPLDL